MVYTLALALQRLILGRIWIYELLQKGEVKLLFLSRFDHLNENFMPNLDRANRLEVQEVNWGLKVVDPYVKLIFDFQEGLKIENA